MWEKDIGVFRSGVTPLVEAAGLAAVLLQFPYSFGYTTESRERLATLCGRSKASRWRWSFAKATGSDPRSSRACASEGPP